MKKVYILSLYPKSINCLVDGLEDVFMSNVFLTYGFLTYGFLTYVS